MDSDPLFHCEEDDDLGFPNYNKSQPRLKRTHQMRGRNGEQAPEIHISKLDGGKSNGI